MTSYHRLGATALMLAFATACSDSATVNAPNFQPLAAVGTGLVGGPDLNDPLSWEGDLYICKDGTPTGVDFKFDYQIVRASNQTVVASGTATVASGTCVNAASVSTQVSGQYHATVTEQTPPAGWSLTGITYAYAVGDNPPAPTISVPTATISNTVMSNDAGVMVTFLNAFDPPSGPSCTLTQGFWKNHQELWNAAGEKVVVTTDLFFGSGKTYAQLMGMPPAGGNSYIQLAHQYIAAILNLNGGSDPAIDAAVAQATALFAAHPAGSYTIKNKAWTALAGTIDDYNNGKTGPGHCN
jgi:hypothetical protein